MDSGVIVGWSLGTKIEEDILVATIIGTVDKNVYLAARGTVISLFKETATASHILIDIRQAVLRTSVIGIFEIAETSHEVIPSKARYAVVYSSSALAERNGHFGENVAVNRGANLKAFTDIAEAKQWLTGKPGKTMGRDKL